MIVASDNATRQGLSNMYGVRNNLKKTYEGIPEEELYDTLNDPFEMNNLAGKSEHLSLKSKLKSLLFGWMERQKDYLSTTNSIPYFKIWRHELDVQDPQFNYSIEDDKVGILEGKKVSHHKYGI